MKSHQFEEITAALSILIALVAYGLDVRWLMWIYILKATGDTYFAIMLSWREHKRNHKQ